MLSVTNVLWRRLDLQGDLGAGRPCGSTMGVMGGPSATRTASNGEVFNDADVRFASEMIQHHAQALSMVDLTAGRPLDAEVEKLAEDIRAAQAPEIEIFTGWLIEWGEKVPETVRDHANAGHGDDSDHGSMQDHSDMPGMMSADQMEALSEASDTDFQSMWLEMMIDHHEGAVEMARTEQSEGRHRPAVELAKQIESSQSDEIELMQSLLG
jgi:uncharacterized protein (DUF305 family)